MYLNNIHILYYVLFVILGVISSQITAWCIKRMPEHQKVITKDFFKEFKINYILMAITVIIIQQIDSNIINPKILGDGLKISPILVIFAVTIGGEFFGVLGMFLAVPIIAIIKLLIIPSKSSLLMPCILFISDFKSVSIAYLLYYIVGVSAVV